MSWCHNFLSNGIDAFISRMIDEGPSANRPPHILFAFWLFLFWLLESDMRFTLKAFLMILMPVALAACDRGSDGVEQDIAAPAADNPGQKSDHKALVGRLDISDRGAPVVDTPFFDADDKTVRLSDFQGKPLLVNIWATWCAPCIVEMPMLDALAAKEKDRLQVLVVSQDIQGRERVEPFFAKANFAELEAYIDPENGLSFGIGSGMMPTTVLYDAQGKEVWRVIGAMDWDGPRAAALMEETLAGG